MQSDTVRTVKGCLACARVKTPYRHTKDPMYGFLPSEPFSHVHVDLAGPLPADRKGNTHILCITCSMSRWTVLVAIGEDSDGHIDAIAIANSMVENWIKYYGVPECIISDKGSVFEAEIHRELMRALGAKTRIVEPEAQFRNGKAERMFKYVKDRIKIWRKEGRRDWPTLLPYIEMSQRFTVMPRYMYSPWEIVTGLRARLPFAQPKLSDAIPESMIQAQVQKMHLQLESIQQSMRAIDKAETLKRLKKVNADKVSRSFESGDMAIWYSKGSGKDKLSVVWSDVVRIEDKIGPSTYRIRFPSGETLKVPIQSLRKFTPVGRTHEGNYGPLMQSTKRYTHEGNAMGSSLEENLHILPRSNAKILEFNMNERPKQVQATENSQWKDSPEDSLPSSTVKPNLAPLDEEAALSQEAGFWKSLARDKRFKLDLAKRKRLLRRLKSFPMFDVQEKPHTSPIVETPQSVTVSQEDISLDSETQSRRLQYGDYVAYVPNGGKGWEIGIYLEQEADVPQGMMELCGLTSTANSRKHKLVEKLVFKMAWSGTIKGTKREKTVLGPLDELHKPPSGGSVKIQGLETILVPQENIITTVSLTVTGKLHSSSMQDIREKATGVQHAKFSEQNSRKKPARRKEKRAQTPPSEGTRSGLRSRRDEHVSRIRVCRTECPEQTDHITLIPPPYPSLTQHLISSYFAGPHVFQVSLAGVAIKNEDGVRPREYEEESDRGLRKRKLQSKENTFGESAGRDTLLELLSK